MLFFLIFLIIPLTEVALFAVVGGEIGALNTLLLCVVTAMIGSYLVRRQGLEALMSARQKMESSDMPVKEIFDGICLFAAGLLMITPGFFTDGVGFALLVPFVRNILRHYGLKYLEIRLFGAEASEFRHQKSTGEEGVIDAEYEVVNKEEPFDDDAAALGSNEKSDNDKKEGDR